MLRILKWAANPSKIRFAGYFIRNEATLERKVNKNIQQKKISTNKATLEENKEMKEKKISTNEATLEGKVGDDIINKKFYADDVYNLALGMDCSENEVDLEEEENSEEKITKEQIEEIRKLEEETNDEATSEKNIVYKDIMEKEIYTQLKLPKDFDLFLKMNIKRINIQHLGNMLRAANLKYNLYKDLLLYKDQTAYRQVMASILYLIHRNPEQINSPMTVLICLYTSVILRHHGTIKEGHYEYYDGLFAKMFKEMPPKMINTILLLFAQVGYKPMKLYEEITRNKEDIQGFSKNKLFGLMKALVEVKVLENPILDCINKKITQIISKLDSVDCATAIQSYFKFKSFNKNYHSPEMEKTIDLCVTQMKSNNLYNHYYIGKISETLKKSLDEVEVLKILKAMALISKTFTLETEAVLDWLCSGVIFYVDQHICIEIFAIANSFGYQNTSKQKKI